ncbi:MAG: hypothetical protein H6581_21485 [Bacteroidia bacterium]|nr:hypothetical protein [Bacteroidia bacterium]
MNKKVEKFFATVLLIIFSLCCSCSPHPIIKRASSEKAASLRYNCTCTSSNNPDFFVQVEQYDTIIEHQTYKSLWISLTANPERQPDFLRVSNDSIFMRNNFSSDQLFGLFNSYSEQPRPVKSSGLLSGLILSENSNESANGAKDVYFFSLQNPGLSSHTHRITSLEIDSNLFLKSFRYYNGFNKYSCTAPSSHPEE